MDVSDHDQCWACQERLGHADDCPLLKGRCHWCGISLTWWERLLGLYYVGYCGTCIRALMRDDPSPPMPYLSRYWLCRKYQADHRDYCAGHHQEMYP